MSLSSSKTSPVSILHLRAAGLHLRLSAFFDSPTSKDYLLDLLSLFEASTQFLEYALSLQGPDGSMLIYATNYILQMIIAAAFTLLKLLNSFFATYFDQVYGKNLFTRAVYAIRSISVKENDLPSRFGEVLAQFWKASGAGSKKVPPATSAASTPASENSLQLKVTCRMSMSLVYDSAWRWREEFQSHGKRDLEGMLIVYPELYLPQILLPMLIQHIVAWTVAVKNPTVPESTAGESSSNSVTGENNLAAPSGSHGLNTGNATTTTDLFGESYSNDVFDPLNWIFDGDVPLPYSLDDMRNEFPRY